MIRNSALLVGSRVIALAVVALLATTEAEATSARVRSLGGSGGYFEDDNNVLRWYGTLTEYGDLALLELGTYNLDLPDAPHNDRVTGQGGGFHIDFDSAGRWGTAAIYAQENTPGGTPGGSFTALYGNRFGPIQGSLYFRGTSFTRSDVSDEVALVGLSEYLHDFGLGLRVDAGEGIYFDLAGEIMNSQFDAADHGRYLTSETVSSWDSYGARARVFLKLSEKVALVPLFDYAKDDRMTYSVLLRDAADLNAHLTRAGFGFNILPDTDNLIVFSAEYRNGAEDLDGQQTAGALFSKSRSEFFSLHTRFGFESRLTSWLVLRGGVEYRRIDEESYRYQVVPGDVDFVAGRSVQVEVPLNLGLGFAFGKFGADLVINDHVPFSFGYLFTGGELRDAATFTSITLSYWF